MKPVFRDHLWAREVVSLQRSMSKAEELLGPKEVVFLYIER